MAEQELPSERDPETGGTEIGSAGTGTPEEQPDERQETAEPGASG